MKQLRFFASAGLLACLLGWANVAQAQQEGQSEANNASQRLVEDFGFSALDQLPAPATLNTRNLAKLVQLGTFNKARAEQDNPGSFANQAYILQVGSFNEAILVQRGSGNTTTINQQGNDNTATSKVRGDGNTTKLNQIGNGNEFVRDVTTNQTSFTLTQFGNSNKLRQTGTESLAPPRYEVEMRGNGIQLSIQNGRIGQ
ncbi:hypothetical protein [Hymenobacter lapidiphilus]|uniref:Curlin associated repeat-containing protein n=1 Tax=Hymenobacter lapidiphilus TaxID=2608003 RepID=A0A7Y7U4J5_9BACT|nr:hypothetical protein [Hymenobacter lapidiphilus]NVO30312.1 hypothetical protein [Hymenobacter lapidiphilus]